MIKPSLRLFRCMALLLCAIPVTLFAQAAVEYALKSGGSVLPASAGSAIAGCNVDSAVLTCLSHSYPRASILTAVVIGLLIVRWLAAGSRVH
jgi:hypothetical protein